MSKLQDMFTQVRRGQSGGSMGFLGKNRASAKPRSAAIVIEFAGIDEGKAEATVKTGVDGLLFNWDGKDSTQLEKLKKAIESAKTTNDTTSFGLHITGGWEKLTREALEQLKEQGIHYIILPLSAPARLLGTHVKDLDIVVTVPMHEGDLYPIFTRNLTAFDGIAAVQLDFGLSNEAGTMSIEDVMHYRAVRESVRFPALLNVRGKINEDDAYTLLTLGVQGIILTASDADAATAKQIQTLRELLEKIHQETKEAEAGTNLPGRS